MPALQNNGGDILARGGVRAQFKPAGSHLTREEWEEMWSKSEVKKAVYLLECPVHGQFEGSEFFLSGGYPQGPDEYKQGKCPVSECGEMSKYAGFKPI